MAVRITRAGVGLTIGIIILALVVLGGLYLVKQRGEQARRDQAVKIAEQNLESQSNGANVLSPDDSSKNSSNSSNSSNSGSQGSSSTSNNSSSGSSSPSNGVASTGELPQTGPSDGIAFVALGLLTFAGVSYYISRRTLVRIR